MCVACCAADLYTQPQCLIHAAEALARPNHSQDPLGLERQWASAGSSGRRLATAAAAAAADSRADGLPSAAAKSHNGFEAGFVAAFAQGSVGDTSPNVLGAFCIDTGACCCCMGLRSRFGG